VRFATRLVSRKPIMGACGFRSMSKVDFEELTVRGLDGNSFVCLPVLLKSMTTIVSVRDFCVSSPVSFLVSFGL
jgi:hypothetical protein